MARYFGTDGIRGKAGEGKLSVESLERLAYAIGLHFGPGSKAIIGRDTRESGDTLKTALTKGLRCQGVDVISVGILPTPGTAMLVEHLDGDFGLMITASHNPWHDNGVKLFGPDGRKISDGAQDEIEKLIEAAMGDGLPAAPSAGQDIGEISHDGVYIEALLSAFRKAGGTSLSGLKVVVDCANGAAFKALPAVMKSLACELTVIGAEPDGRNINAGCGSTHPEALSAAVKAQQADIGIALDGDADRLILVDDAGHVVDGDQIIARLATDWHAAGHLKGRAVVSTVMSNLGLEHYLKTLGLTLERTAVGDRHVAARMTEIGANLGGEPSGHLLMTDYGVTGDGSLAALMVLAGLQQSENASRDYLNVFTPFPQKLKNVRYSGASPLKAQLVMNAIARTDEGLGEMGRVLVRASGTEPVIRVMAEGQDFEVVTAAVNELCELIESVAD